MLRSASGEAAVSSLGTEFGFLSWRIRQTITEVLFLSLCIMFSAVFRLSSQIIPLDLTENLPLERTEESSWGLLEQSRVLFVFFWVLSHDHLSLEANL